ncbi:MAG: threonine/serine exporter [Tissierellia bacterium]|nr:threonine/serine exporter [Tissierellia bacterium]
MNIMKQLLFSFLSTIGFAVLFSIPKDSISKSGITGALGWIVFYIASNYFHSKIVGSFFAATTVGILGELLARRYKKPATIYIIPGIIPLVPGAGAYYTMLALIENDFILAAKQGTETLFIAAAISMGITISTFLSKSIKRVKYGD